MVVVERERNEGANVLAWVVALVLILLLVVGAVWLWNSGAFGGAEQETDINIEVPADGGSAPDDGGALPDDGGTAPDDGGAVPDDGGAVPDDGTAPQQ